MAENRLKIRIRRMLRSCKSKDQTSDVVETHPYPTRRRRHHLIELFSPLPEQQPYFTPKFPSPDVNGRKCPPASPVIPPLPNHKRKPQTRKKGRSGFEDRFPDCKYNGLFSSSDDEDDGRRDSASRRRMESLAVVKRSSDPYTDFRTSMVEMIVEKQIFAAEDLENLLHCFLSLNSYHHHKIIIQVFAEIWEALLLH